MKVNDVMPLPAPSDVIEVPSKDESLSSSTGMDENDEEGGGTEADNNEVGEEESHIPNVLAPRETGQAGKEL